jgi:hypothetical protein
MQLNINGLLTQMERYRLESELVLVEWNPPPDRPLLREAFPWPKNLMFSKIRIITVPSSIHKRYEYSDRVNIHHMVARNVGIRRARGKFVLSTGVDMLLSNELVEYLAKKQLNENLFYRIDRLDVNRKVLAINSLDEQLSFCKQNIVDIHTFKSRANMYFLGTHVPVLHPEGPGDFIILSRERWNWLRGFPEIDVVSLHSDTILCYMAYISGAKEKILEKPLYLYHIDHNSIWQSPLYIFLRKLFVRLRLSPTLVNKFSSFGSKIIPIKSKLQKLGVPTLSGSSAKKIILGMIQGKRSFIYNDEHWGLGNESLLEWEI